MSISYSIKIKLNADFNQDNIHKILKKGIKKGFIYYNHVWGEKYENSSLLDIDMSVNKILKMNEPDYEDDKGIYTKYFDTFFFLTLYKDNNNISLDAGAFGYPWIKKFWNSDDDIYIDFSRYIYTYLDLCEDLIIKKIEIYTIE